MADPNTAPALPSTADTTPYVPVSWMAVAAAAVAGLFIVVLLVMGVSAYSAKKPLIQPGLLALPIFALVLSFAARRMIRNSEGTRTGENLANFAWWVAVIAGPGYFAYLMAIDYSVRRDARNELVRWVDNIRAGDEADLNRAFLRTREPARRSRIDAENTAEIKGLFRDDYLAFEQCDLVRFLRRNKGDESTFEPGGVREWMDRPGGIECVYTGVVKCPEGSLTINVPLRGMDPGSAAEGVGRQWGITLQPNYLAADRLALTRYGWLIQILEASGARVGQLFIERAEVGPWVTPYLYHALISPNSDWNAWETTLALTTPRTAVVGGLGVAVPQGVKGTPELGKFFRNEFFRPVGGGDADQKRALFKVIWESLAILPPERRLKNSPDKNPILTVTETGVEVRVPCELPFPGTDGSLSAARGRLIVACNDPALVAELKQLRAEANPDKGTPMPPDDLRSRQFKWRVVGLESDMAKVQVQQQQRPEMGGGMMGGH